MFKITNVNSVVFQNRLLAMNYINEGHDDKLYEAHRSWQTLYSVFVIIIIYDA